MLIHPRPFPDINVSAFNMSPFSYISLHEWGLSVTPCCVSVLSLHKRICSWEERLRFSSCTLKQFVWDSDYLCLASHDISSQPPGVFSGGRSLFLVSLWSLPWVSGWLRSELLGPCLVMWDHSCRCTDSSCHARAYLLHGMWDLSSPTRDQIHIPCIARWILNPWTTREVPYTTIFFFFLNFTILYWFCQIP